MLFAANESDTQVPTLQPLQLQNPNKPLDNPVFERNPLEGNRDVLLSQIPDTINSANMACQLDSAYPFEADVADDIQPSGAGWQIDSVISWWWNWNGFTSWSNVPNIHFLVYDDNGGQPADNPSQELVVDIADYTVYEYVAGERWRLEMELPSTVNLTGGVTYWIEIQPSNVFTSNGQTGIIGDPACGNGQEAYFRSQVLGYPNWVTATTVFGQANEAGFILIGTPMGGTLHDVGVAAINAPGTTEMPNTVIAPQAVYRNYGTETETTLASASETTYTWPNWTTGPNDGITYDVMAYTVLSGDENPANDTMAMQTVTQSVYWETLTSIPSATSGHSEATINDGTYMVFGFHPSGQYPATTYIYDIASASWSQGPDNPYGCGAYGIAYGVGGKYYRIGGTDAWPTPLDRVDIYDPGSASWSAGAPAPMANMDMIGGVYRDSLIFMLGGGNWGGLTPHTNVYFYDTYTDAWTTCTSFPSPGRGCLAGGVVDTFVIVAAGYDGSTTFRNDYIVGTFSPSDPSTISWGTATTIPGSFEGRYRVASNVDKWNKELWVTCGQGQTTPQCSDIWSYDPYTDTWTNWNMPKTVAVGNVTPVAITVTSTGDLGVFVVGGYNGSYVTDHEVFHTGLDTLGIVEQQKDLQKPSGFGFAPNMPNPAKGYVPITYTTTVSGKVTLKVFDISGRLIKTLVNRVLEPKGTKTVFWTLKDDAQRSVANGVYFLRLEAESQIATYKLTIIR